MPQTAQQMVEHLFTTAYPALATPEQNNSAPSGIVRVYVRTHYGTKHYYPANKPAELFLSIQGGKTLTANTLRTLKANGYEIEFRYDEEKI
jgi:hypothetical protein